MASEDVTVSIDEVTEDCSTTDDVEDSQSKTDKFAAVSIDGVTEECHATDDVEDSGSKTVKFAVTVEEADETDSSKNNGASATSSETQPTQVHLQPNGPSSSSPTDRPSSPRRRRRDNTPPLDETSLLVAATLITDAKAGRNLPFRTEEKFIRSYILYHKPYLRYLLYFFIFLNLSLALFEKPGLKGAELPYWATMLLELLCLVYFTLRKLHVRHFQHPKVFWRDTKNLMVIGTIALTVFDMLTYIIWTNVAPDKHPVRLTRCLRPLFIINFSDGKQIRRAFRNIRRTVPDILHVLILFFLCVALFGLMGLKLFYKRTYLTYPNGDPYFKNYLDSVWDLYVLVTTANNPDVMMPAYDYDNWFALYFGAYLIINLYIFMSIVLASIYYNYKKNLKNEIKTAVYSKRQQLARAFEIVKVQHSGKSVVTLNRWVQLMGVITPSKSLEQVDLLLKVLDVNGNSFIYKEEFMNLADLLHVELTEVRDRQTFLEKRIPQIYNSPVSRGIRVVVRHRFFRYTFDFMIVVNAFFIGFDVDIADWVFLALFMTEILLKLYVLGPKEFTLRFWNIFDFFVIGAAVIATIVENITGATNSEFSTLDILLVLRVLRLFKLFGSIQRFKIVIQTIVNLGPSILTYGGVMFVFYYFFAIIGMELFQYKVTYHGYNESTTNVGDLWCGNPALQNSTFYRLRYCSNNFNTIIKSFAVLFELTVVNQWHVITSGFVLVIGNSAVRLYFFIFHLCCVVIVLNIFTAFILEAFILEYSLRTSPKVESAVEAKIKQLGLGIGMKQRKLQPPEVDEMELVSAEQPPARDEEPEEDSDSDNESIPDVSGETGLRFHLKKRTRKKTEVLLQQMFQAEIDEDDFGPEENIEEGTEHKSRRRKLTLDTIG